MHRGIENLQTVGLYARQCSKVVWYWLTTLGILYVLLCSQGFERRRHTLNSQTISTAFRISSSNPSKIDGRLGFHPKALPLSAEPLIFPDRNLQRRLKDHTLFYKHGRLTKQPLQAICPLRKGCPQDVRHVALAQSCPGLPSNL